MDLFRIASSALVKWASMTLVVAAMSMESRAQMGGAGGGGTPGVPAFNDPKFRDRLYEAGGPRRSEARDGLIILSVKVEGNQTVSENYVLSHMQSREDRVFDKETFNRDISALYRTNLFRKIDPFFEETPQGVHIRLIISERPIIQSVSYIGNERLEDRALGKHAGIQKGDPLDPISINSARGRLIELYQDKGMNQVDVQIRRGLKPGERDVEFIINEGPVERINQIRVIGNHAFSEELLKARIKSRDSKHGFMPWMFNKASDIKLDEDRQALMGYYRSLGYFDARVDYRKDYNDRGDFIDVTFVVSEGERYSIHSVSIVGTKRYQASELLPYMKLKDGEYFLQTNKFNDEKFLRDVYGAQGHVFCDVVGELVYQPDNKVDVIYNVSEGDIYRAKDVVVHIEGDHTKRRVVENYVRTIRPNSIIDAREVENSERRLRGSTLFNTDPSQGDVPRIVIQPPDQVNDDFR